MPRKPAVPGVDRRQQILEAALSIFAERGFEAATNKEIADQAGVNQGLIYFYFASKADLFFAAFDYHAQAVLKQIDTVFEQRHSEDPVTGFVQILEEITAILTVIRTANLVRMTFQIQSSQVPAGAQSKDRMHVIGMLSQHLTTRLNAYLTEQVDRGSLRWVNTALVASMMTTMLISTVNVRGQGTTAQPTQQEYVDTLASVFCYGLLPRE